jgi:hypothetical protein
MVPISEAVVDVDAMVIELLDTLVADHAVEGELRLDYFAIEAEVFEIYVSVVA